MISRQRTFMWCGVGLVALALIVPPWKFTLAHPQLRIERQAPYALVFSPPEIPQPLPSAEAVQLLRALPGNSERYSDDNELLEVYRRAFPEDERFAKPNTFGAYDRSRWSAHIDWARLLLPVGAIVVITFGLLVSSRKNGRA